jgi:hypothetical protein
MRVLGGGAWNPAQGGKDEFFDAFRVTAVVIVF